jgi:hypothetical protein
MPAHETTRTWESPRLLPLSQAGAADKQPLLQFESNYEPYGPPAGPSA